MHFFAGILHPCHILHQGRYRNYFVSMPLLKPRSTSELCVFNTLLSHVSGHTYMYKEVTTVATIRGHLPHICTNIILSPNWHPICYCKCSADCWWLTVIIFLGLLGGKTINSADVSRGEYLTCRGRESSIPKKTSYIPHILPLQLEHMSVALAGPSFVCSVSRSCCCCHASNLYDHPIQHK